MSGGVIWYNVFNKEIRKGATAFSFLMDGFSRRKINKFLRRIPRVVSFYLRNERAKCEFIHIFERMSKYVAEPIFRKFFASHRPLSNSPTSKCTDYLSPALSSAEAERDVEPSPPQRRGQGEVSLTKRQGEDSGKVVLSTVHQAKGLEWEAVFIINLANGSFPSERSAREPRGLEEERRLLYVAITRAKRKLVLTYPMAGGMYGDFLSGPSRFLDEINPDFINDHSLLSSDVTVLNDPSEGVEYVSEDPASSADGAPKKFSPGSFLRDINDL